MENDKETNAVAIDVDGVIASYNRWKGVGVFGDVIKGCKEEIAKLKEAGWTVIINTTRGEIEDVRQFLTANEIQFDHINENPDKPDNCTDKKVMANAYVDDRAIPFGGRWEGMAQRIMDFKPWNKIDQRRPTLPIEIAGYRVDQVSLFVKSIDRSLEAYRRIGHSKWFVDEVLAENTLNDQMFSVKLAFNYTVLPVEFELLEVTSGSTIQVPMNAPAGLSHFGFHVDDMDAAIKAFCSSSGTATLMAEIHTRCHSSAPSRYHYTFIDTRKLGFISKLIAKLED